MERHYRTAKRRSPWPNPSLLLLVTALAAAACSGTAAAPTAAPSTGADSPSGVVIGPLDSHCNASDGGLTIQTIGVCEVIDPTTVPANAASCNVSFNTDGGAGTDDSDGGVATSDYGPTMYGSAGDDDDCKYFVSWTATPITENADTFFTVTALRLADMTPASCAGVRPDVSLSISHGVPAPPNPSTEIAPGVYKVGPIKFDAAGTWTVRFHFFEECSDNQEDSPHGHAAFYVQGALRTRAMRRLSPQPPASTRGCWGRRRRARRAASDADRR